MEKQSPEANSEPCQVSKTECLAKITIFIIFAKRPILDVFTAF